MKNLGAVLLSLQVLCLPAFAAPKGPSPVEARNVDIPPTKIHRRATSPDGTCGNQNSGAGRGYTCPSDFKCCSTWGWCGNSADHCGSGCQSAFGSCNGVPPPTPPPTNPPAGSPPIGQVITQCRVPGMVALTYDDGPWEHTGKLLDILRNNNIKATFFVNGQNWGPVLSNSPYKGRALNRMIAEGHQVASHTWSHADLSTLNSAQITTEMNTLENTLNTIMGKRPRYMRPPYLSCSSTCLSTLRNLGFHIIGTNLDTNDWKYTTLATIHNAQNTFNDFINRSTPSRDSFIVLAHEVHPTTVEPLTQGMINTARAKGYTFGTVGECMGMAASTWYK